MIIEKSFDKDNLDEQNTNCILNEIRCSIVKCIYLDERFIRLLRTMNFDDEGGGRV